MMKSRKLRFSVFTLFSFILISVYAPLCIGKVLIEDDFEKNNIDNNKWIPTDGWSLDGGKLDVNGGGVGISKVTDLTEFEFNVDFNMVNPLWSANWVVHAEDQDNCTLVQIVADARNQFWWFTRVNGAYDVPDHGKLDNKSGVHPELGKWYTIKIVVKDGSYDIFLGERGDDLELCCTWKDKTHSKGAVGFRAWTGEHTLYDNVLVTTVGHVSPVNPEDALPVTWGKLKMQR